jgi:hypothetical protein
MPAKFGPPAFLYSEIVRVVDDDNFSGQEGWVCGARPTLDQDGWMIEVMVETTDASGQVRLLETGRWPGSRSGSWCMR